MKFWALLATLAVVMTPGQAAAQQMDAKRLPPGVTVNGVPGTKPSADLYYLVGEVGAKETYTLSIKGPASISLFTPDGHEMVRATGSGKVVLDAILNFTDVFVLSVSRVDPRQAYTLSRSTVAPTFAEITLSNFVGYSRETENGIAARCWVTPGVRTRETISGQVRNITLAADRNTLIVQDTKSGGSTPFEQTFRLAKFQYHVLIRMPDGKVGETSRPYPETQFAFTERQRPRFTGYLCK